jgi:hypothetical protein
MDHADDGDDGDDDVFVYMGGDQEVPWNVTHVRVHKSVKIIPHDAFEHCTNLVSVEIHDGVEEIEEAAFYGTCLRGIKLSGVRFIGAEAFNSCTSLEDVEFGDKLETIRDLAFEQCTSIRNIKLQTVRFIGIGTFGECEQLTDVKFPKDLEGIGELAFSDCPHLRRIAIPLKDNLLDEGAFHNCRDLSQVDLIGGIHTTVSSLLLDSWRNEMKDEIDRINQVLSNTHTDYKTEAIQQWMERVRDRMEHYKSEHYALLKNNMTQLELALWKANLSNVDAAASRDEARVTCGANIIIPHVLSFLNDHDEFPLRDYNL